jgi:hypothetical protein
MKKIIDEADASTTGVRQGLKPVFVLDALRGAEAPLFHGTAAAIFGI